jgi:hypothetical protein
MEKGRKEKWTSVCVLTLPIFPFFYFLKKASFFTLTQASVLVNDSFRMNR